MRYVISFVFFKNCCIAFRIPAHCSNGRPSSCQAEKDRQPGVLCTLAHYQQNVYVYMHILLFSCVCACVEGVRSVIYFHHARNRTLPCPRHVRNFNYLFFNAMLLSLMVSTFSVRPFVLLFSRTALFLLSFVLFLFRRPAYRVKYEAAGSAFVRPYAHIRLQSKTPQPYNSPPIFETLFRVYVDSVEGHHNAEASQIVLSAVLRNSHRLGAGTHEDVRHSAAL